MSNAYNFNVLFATMVLLFGSQLQTGYNISVLNLLDKYVTEFFKQVQHARDPSKQLGDTMVAILWQLESSIMLLGIIIGAVLAGYLSDRFKRKSMLVLAHIILVVGVVLSTCSVPALSIEMLVIGRIITSIPTGISTAIIPAYLSEFAEPQARGALLAVYQMFLTLGLCLGNVMGFRQVLGTEDLWQYVFLIILIPTVLSVGFLPFIPESPRFLIIKKREEAAGEAALRFYRMSEDVEEEFNELMTLANYDLLHPTKQFPISKLFQRKLRRPVMIMCGLQAVQQLSGMAGVMFYSKGIFDRAGVAEDANQYAVLGTSANLVVMTLISVPLMDLVGRRIMLIVPLLAMLLAVIVLTIALVETQRVPSMAYVGIASVQVYVAAFAVGPASVPWLIAAEVFAQDSRAKALMLAVWTNSLCIFIVTMTFEHLSNAFDAYAFVIFAVLIASFVVFVFIWVPETRHKSMEEIQKKMKVPLRCGCSKRVEQDRSSESEILEATEKGDPAGVEGAPTESGLPEEAGAVEPAPASASTDDVVNTKEE